ncbi:superoxide dismutase family protein [Sphingomonas parva]|uniref:Superoxide dismutase family protein n=1 Tax=Sphingomonas parva TaxID=2555898 RepID=A0A4Y8ZMZ3_9SPHN|nr:superoxide dismutase family protein [Sphingomonas parva]TFI57378.1 superoxide dismutase family protein [Sphingomonas parva]
MKLGTLILGSAVLALGACATGGDEGSPQSDAGPASVSAEIRDATGRVVAQSTAEEVGDGIRVRVESVALPQGAYGAHVHVTGRCDPPAFTTAGPHWNPTGRQHGKDNPQGMHKGDLPNLLVGTDGRGSFEYTIPDASLTGGASALLDADGAAVVVHQSADDYRTDPSGNSGNRIACGVLG